MTSCSWITKWPTHCQLSSSLKWLTPGYYTVTTRLCQMRLTLLKAGDRTLYSLAARRQQLRVIVCDGGLMEDTKPRRRRQTDARSDSRTLDNCYLLIISDWLDDGTFQLSFVFRYTFRRTAECRVFSGVASMEQMEQLLPPGTPRATYVIRADPRRF